MCEERIWEASSGWLKKGQTVTLKLPPGYEIEWGGQFENQARANRRLAFVLPVSVCNHLRFAVCDLSFAEDKRASSSSTCPSHWSAALELCGSVD